MRNHNLDSTSLININTRFSINEICKEYNRVIYFDCVIDKDNDNDK